MSIRHKNPDRLKQMQTDKHPFESTPDKEAEWQKSVLAQL